MDLSYLTLRHSPTVIVAQLDKPAGHRFTHAAHLASLAAGFEIGHESKFGSTVELVKTCTGQLVEECFLGLRQQRRSTAHQHAQRAEIGIIDLAAVYQTAPHRRHHECPRRAIALDEVADIGRTAIRRDDHYAAAQKL